MMPYHLTFKEQPMAAADTKPSARDEAPIPAAAEPVLAGTLALMTSFYHRMPDPDVCRKRW